MDPNIKLVPEGKTFSRNLLLTPSLIEMGVPKVMSCLPNITTHAKIGAWITRDEPLLTYHFYFYPTLEKPPAWKLWDRDKPNCFSYTLNSPISGWVVNFRRVGCRSFSVPYRACFSHLIDCEGNLPTILIPADEPRWENCGLNKTTRFISSDISRYWDTNVHNCGQKYNYKIDRLINVIDQGVYNFGSVGDKFNASDGEIQEAIAWAKDPFSTIRDKSWIVCDYDDIKNHQTEDNDSFYDLDSYIEEYRSQALQLRLLFSHLAAKNGQQQ